MNICETTNFKMIFLKYQERLERYLRARGAGISEASDITQDTFLRLWEKCKKIEEEGVKSFLYLTGERILIDQYRRKQTREKYRATLSWKENITDGQYKMEMEEYKEKLEKVLSSMKNKEREVFMLNRFEKMKYKEIAAKLDLSVKAVEKRMHNALRFLASHQFSNI